MLFYEKLLFKKGLGLQSHQTRLKSRPHKVLSNHNPINNAQLRTTVSIHSKIPQVNISADTPGS